MLNISLLTAVVRPFRMNVDFDNFEIQNGGANADNAKFNELFDAPGGIVGFSLDFSQTAC